VHEDAQYLELIDNATGRAVSSDEPGDMVVTSLYRDDVYPLIRFNTHDLSAWVGGASSIGWNLRRITGVLGRSDNMVKLRGINVYPLALAAILNEHGSFAGEYVCRAERDATGRDVMSVIIETRDGAARTSALVNEFAALLTRRLGVDLDVELVPPGGTRDLTQIDSRQKPIRLIDRRPKERIL
jgi:phenylacetate-CoA ligase